MVEGRSPGRWERWRSVSWLTDLDIDFEYCAGRLDDDFDFKVGEYRIDVKTKKTHGEPRDETIHGKNPESRRSGQQCDIYVFTYATRP